MSRTAGYWTVRPWNNDHAIISDKDEVLAHVSNEQDAKIMASAPELTETVDELKDVIAQLLEDARRLQQLEPCAGTEARILNAIAALSY